MIKYFKNIFFAIFRYSISISNYNSIISDLKEEVESLKKQTDSLDFEYDRKKFELEEQLAGVRLSLAEENATYNANEHKYTSIIKNLETEKDCLGDRLVAKNNEIKRLSTLVESLVKVKVPDVKVVK